MKHTKLLVIGFWSSLLALPVLADESGDTTLENSVSAAPGNQTQTDAGTMPGGAKGGAPETVTAKETGKAAPKRKSAGTGTLLRYIYDQDKAGNIKIEGMTDTAPPP